MNNKEAIEIIDTAIAEVEWEYPMDYAIAFDMAKEVLQNAEKYKWHDLRENPEDLPVVDKRVLIAFRVWQPHISYKVAQLSINKNDRCFYPDGNSRIEFNNVMAWKEIEGFFE